MGDSFRFSLSNELVRQTLFKEMWPTLQKTCNDFFGFYDSYSVIFIKNVKYMPWSLLNNVAS